MLRRRNDAVAATITIILILYNIASAVKHIAERLMYRCIGASLHECARAHEESNAVVHYELRAHTGLHRNHNTLEKYCVVVMVVS